MIQLSGKISIIKVVVKVSMSSTGAIVNVIIRIFRWRFEAAVELTPQPSPKLECALCVGKWIFLLLQFGIVVRELVEQNGNGHSIKNDAKRDAGKRHAAAKVGDWDDISITNSRDAHLQEGESRVSFQIPTCTFYLLSPPNFYLPKTLSIIPLDPFGF